MECISMTSVSEEDIDDDTHASEARLLYPESLPQMCF